MNKILKKITYIGLTVLLPMGLFANSVQKKAFAHGITSAVKAIEAEKKQSLKPLTKEYCIAMRGVYGKEMSDTEIVRLEVLASFLGVNPSYLSYSDSKGQAKKLLCLGMSKSKKGADKLLGAIRKKHKPIDKYTPTVIALKNLNTYKRIIPAIGQYHEDQTPAINLLSKNIERLKKEKNKEIKILTEKLESERKALKSLRSKLRGLYSDSSMSESELKESKERAKKKANDTLIAKKKAALLEKKRKEEEKMKLSTGGKIVQKVKGSNIYTVERK
ncbi:MAG: Unknown protein [uncultured Sulfurovum sp.]|uniref:Uncharacterized protein n=1 Tax=uncultured Sulfurovum sp. TaxID=269237 RepID=A0A6S6SA39_9BACT|nr:MAG: Unknown protein [uncultured Sulfurovum sp.]